MTEKIIANSVLDVKATAALSKEIAKELAEAKEEKNMEELLSEHQRTTGNDRNGSSRHDNPSV